MRYVLPAVLLLAALILTGCGTDTPTATPIVIVVTATPEPNPPTPVPPTAVPSDTPVPVTNTPDPAATAQAYKQATITAENAARATAVAQAQATQTQLADVAARATVNAEIAATRTEEARPTQTPLPPRTIEITELAKGFQEADYLAGDSGDTITFTATFVNHLGKNVRAFKGVVKFYDLFGGLIMNMTVNITDPVKAGKSLTWKGALDYNQFMDDDRKLKNTDGKDLLFDFKLTDVIYSDGTQESFGGDTQ